MTKMLQRNLLAAKIAVGDPMKLRLCRTRSMTMRLFTLRAKNDHLPMVFLRNDLDNGCHRILLHVSYFIVEKLV